MDMVCQVSRRVCGRVRRVARPHQRGAHWHHSAQRHGCTRIRVRGAGQHTPRCAATRQQGKRHVCSAPPLTAPERAALWRAGRTGHAPWGCPAGLPCLAARLRPAGAGARWRTGPVRRPCRSGGERQCRTIPSAPPFRECMGIRFYGRPRRNVGELVAAAACVPLGELLWAGALCCF